MDNWNSVPDPTAVKTDVQRFSDNQAASKFVVILAYDDVNLVDISGPLQAFATINRWEGLNYKSRYKTVVASCQGGLISTGCGLEVMTESLDSIDPRTIHTLIVPGGSRSQTFYTPSDLALWLKNQAGSVPRLCSVCTGAFILASTGLIRGRKVATHWAWAEQLQALHPEIIVDAQPIFIKDGNLWTSAGVTAGIDMALALIEEDLGHKAAIYTARHLVVFIKRPGGQSQFSVPLVTQSLDTDRFNDLHTWIANNLAADLTIERLAERIGMSARSFARVYKEKIGKTPARTISEMRIEAVCRDLEQTDMPLKKISDRVGISHEQNMRRLFVRYLGVTPAQYRSRFNRQA